MFIPIVAGAYLIPLNLPSPINYVFNYVNIDFSFNSVFLFPWANFDGIHYLDIAKHGYINQARFFPFFPLLIKTLSAPVLPIINSPLTQFFVSILFVNIVFFLALLILKKLVELDYSKEISRKSILYLLIFPTSFFFISIYSESLFLLFVLLALYLARKKRWFLSIICGMLVMVTRFVGVAILPVLLYEFFIDRNMRIKNLALFLIAPLGLVAYSLFNYYQWNNFLYFITSQGELGNNRSVSSIVLFPQTVFRYVKILAAVPVSSYDLFIALLELVSFLFTAVLMYFAWKKKIRTSYLLFALINFAVATSTGTFSGLPRYIITLFPIFIALALIKNRLFKYLYVTMTPILLFILLMLFSRGYFVA